MNTTNLSKREVQEFTFHQCFTYQGFGGSIKVPAPAKYAEKLANKAKQLKLSSFSHVVGKNLHFL